MTFDYFTRDGQFLLLQCIEAKQPWVMQNYATEASQHNISSQPALCIATKRNNVTTQGIRRNST